MERPYVDALVHIQVGQSSLEKEHESESVDSRARESKIEHTVSEMVISFWAGVPSHNCCSSRCICYSADRV